MEIEDRSDRRATLTIPLLGREPETQALWDGLSQAESGHGALFLVAGEPGIGKTRLADWFATAARTRGAQVAWGRCWEEGGAPAYWPWVQALGTIVRGAVKGALDDLPTRHRSAVAAIIPEIDTEISPRLAETADDAATARFRLFEAVLALLRAASSVTPIVLVLDDVHASDEPSLLLLRFVAAGLQDASLVVVALYRDGELSTDDPRTGVLADVGRSPTTRMLRPRGLTEHDVARLIEATTAVAVDEHVVAEIHRETDGNPLFVEEYVRMLADEGGFTSPSHRPVRPIDLTSGVRAMIGRRLSRLNPASRALLARASVLGKEFSLDVLSRAENIPPDALIEQFDEAIAATILVQPVPGGRWRFHHALIRDVLYDGLPTSARIRLHRATGAALQAEYGDDPESHLAELAHHFVHAAPGGDADAAIDYARRAAARADRLYAHEEAARLYRMALGVESSIGGDGTERCPLLIGLGEAETKAGNLIAAREAFSDAAEVARDLDLPQELARAAIGYGGRWVWSRAGDDHRLVPLLMDALERLSRRDSPERARLLARLAGALRDEPSFERRDALSTEALAMARRIGDPRTLSYALASRYNAIMGPDALDEMPRLLDELVGIAEASGDRELLADGEMWLGGMRLATARRDGRTPRDWADDYARIANELRQLPLQWSVGVFRTIVALLEGRLPEAERLIDETVRLGRRAQPWDAEFSWLVAIVALRREQDRLPEVVERIHEGVERFPSYPLLVCLAAFVDAATGRVDDARRVVDEMIRTGFSRLPRDLGWIYGMIFLDEAAVLLDEPAMADSIAARLRPYAALHGTASNEVSAGPVTLALGQSAALNGRWDEAEDQFRAAADSASAMGAELWAIRARIELAGALARRDAGPDRIQATLLLDQALASCRALGLIALERRATQIAALSGGGLAGSSHERRTNDRESSRRMTPESGRTALWRREGEYWSLAYGAAAFRLRHTKGLGYLATLLSTPGREIHVLDLMRAVGGQAIPGRPTGIDDAGVAGLRVDGESVEDPLLDEPARAAYRARLLDLREELEEAESFNDPERAARARAEIDVLLDTLRGAMGLYGRPRRTISHAERARQSVAKAIRDAYRRIAPHDPALDGHLRHAVRTGLFCVYDPDPEARPDWHL